MKMDIKKPIFVVGVGRSGSSVFHKILCKHPNLAWLSYLCDKYVDTPSANAFLMRAIDYPLIGSYLKDKYRPAECYDFWENYCKGFRRPCRDIYAEDVTHKTRDRIQNVMSQMLTPKRDRLLFKITGWPRIGFLKEIFDDAKFIHIVRDGRAVVNSMINVDWWWGWRGPQNWRWGELTAEQNAVWEKHHQSFIALAAIEWNILMDRMETARKFVSPDNFLEIKYEDLCAEPVDGFKRVIEFSELQWVPEFENAVKSHPLKNTNYKWQKELTAHQHHVLNNVMQDYLQQYGYLDSAVENIAVNGQKAQQ